MNDVEDYLQRAIPFLVEYGWVFQESNTKLVGKDILERIPNDWHEALNSLSTEDFNRICAGFISEKFPASLQQFLRLANELKGVVPSPAIESQLCKPIKRMSPKKSHEIDRLSETIHRHCGGSIDVLVDLGSGLGYLSQHLNERYGFKVLGLEADTSRVHSARKRQQKYFPTSLEFVKYESHFISQTSFEFIMATVQKHFPTTGHSYRIGLVGLHACADLTVTAVRLACCNAAVIKTLIIMPCCYHKMEQVGHNGFVNFPLSKALGETMTNSSQEHIFGRPFLRLACQQSVRHLQGMTEAEHRIHGNEMFTRALVDAILGPDSGMTVTRINRHIVAQLDEGFDAICRAYRIDRGGQIQEWTATHRHRFDAYVTKYPSGWQLAEVLTTLQATVQEVCENVVLLDKVAYIREAGDSCRRTCELQKITREDLSPRCHALIMCNV